MPDTSIIIRCYNCLMLNRVPKVKLLTKPVCGNCKTILEFPRQPVWAKNENFDRSIAHWPETLLVIFMDQMCLFCKIVDPLVTDLARDKAGKLKVLKVDIETETEVAQRFKIEKTPTFIVYKNGVKVIRVDGAPKEKADLAKWVENLINFTSY